MQVLCNLKSLKVLQLPMPGVKRLSVNSLLLGARDAEFIASNFTELEELSISYLLGNSVNNNIGDRGAIAIGDSLRSLTKLYIRRVQFYLGNNGVSGNTLKELKGRLNIIS